jgi:DNA-binding beta-propeller fold protein YncE
MNAPLKTADLASSESLFVALAGGTYRIERPWAKIAPDVKVGAPTGVAADSHGNVYVYHRFDSSIESIAPPPVLVFDARGEFVTGWGGGMIKDPHHLFIDPQDRVFLVDRDAHQIRIFDTSGKHPFDIGERDKPLKPFNHPCSVATAPSGHIYVAAGYGGTHVHCFANDGSHIRTWGQPGDGPGQFTTPHGIWVMKDGRVLVGDREYNRVQVFDPDGAWVSTSCAAAQTDVDLCRQDRCHLCHRPYTAARRLSERRIVCRRLPAGVNGGHCIHGDSAENLFISEMNPNRVTRMSPVAS